MTSKVQYVLLFHLISIPFWTLFYHFPCLDAIALKKGRTLDEQEKLPTPEIVGIDEFALRKGHHYDTILCDLDSRDVLEVGSGRKKEEVIELLERLSHPDAVKAVSMDMSASFRPAVQEALPKAQIVVDHFHVIQHVSDPRFGKCFPVGHTKRKACYSSIRNNISF